MLQRAITVHVPVSVPTDCTCIKADALLENAALIAAWRRLFRWWRKEVRSYAPIDDQFLHASRAIES